MLIFYRSTEKNLNLEQRLREKYGGDVNIQNYKWLSDNLENVDIPKKYNGRVIGLFEPVIPVLGGEKNKRTKEFVVSNWENGSIEQVNRGIYKSHEEVETEDKRWPKIFVYTCVDNNSQLLESLLGCYLQQNYAGKSLFTIYYSSKKRHEIDKLGYDIHNKKVRLVKEQEEPINLNQISPDIVVYWDESMYYPPSYLSKVVEYYRKSPWSPGIKDKGNKIFFSGFWEKPDSELESHTLPKIENTDKRFDRDIREVDREITPRKLSRKKWIKLNI